MSRDPRSSFYNRPRGRNYSNAHHDFRRNHPVGRKRTRSRSPPSRSDHGKRRSRSPRKSEKDLLDDNILSEIAKLPEPSELWDNQFRDNSNNFAAGPPAPFPQDAGQNANFPPNYQASYMGIYDDFPPVASVQQTNMAPESASWNQMSLPPAPAPFVNVEDQMKKDAAIETEMRHQKAALSKQREDYMKKATILKKELETLKDQRNELRGTDPKRSPSPDTKRFLKENTKLQLEIQNKLKTINNVVDMLNGIIGEEAPEIHDSDDSETGTKRKSRSPSTRKFNYVYYDPEMHWCRVCNEFPPTAKDYLNHLHSAAHNKMAAAHMEAPWHSVTGINEGFPSFPAAPTKRTPIKGLQFFVPSTAWYCKLCDQFIGDLHCASAHLKSVTHSKNYTNFVEQNPHWETDWMSDRQKAFEKARASNKLKTEEKPQYTAHTITFHKDGFHTKNPGNEDRSDKKSKKEKKKKNKKKQSSSSSSSDSDSSSSDSDAGKKRKKVKKEKKIKEEKKLNQWMNRLNETDRKLLDTIKSRMKSEPEPAPRSEERAPRERARERGNSSKRRSASRARSGSPRRAAPAAHTKPDIKKMPFIGKMPVYKHLGKKADEQKKEEIEQKKKEEEESNKKRREEMDAEIQKKVAEFKEKIARAQIAAELPPPGVATPLQLAAPSPAPPPYISMPVAAGAAPALPADLQEALDIIFPAPDAKQELPQQELYLPPFPLPLPFPPLGLMQPQMQQMSHQMFGFDMNAPLFPRAPMYEARPHKPRPPRHNKPVKRQDRQNDKHNHKNTAKETPKATANGQAARVKEEMDDLAMLGIESSDVGAGM